MSATSPTLVTVETARGIGLRGRWGLVAVMMLAALVRVPFWTEALRTPLDGDTAVLGLMARHPLQGLTMWGQPYGSPVEAWFVAPFVAVLGPRAEAVRLAHAVLGLLLVPLAWAMAGALDRRAALPAAFVLACPPPYFLLLSSMPPPLYPAALALSGLLLVAALRYEIAIPAPGRLPPRGWLVVWGLASGLALWTHLMTAGAVLASFVFLLRRAGLKRVAVWGLVPLLAAAGPLAWRLLADPQVLAVVDPSSPRASFGEHLAEVVPGMHSALGGLLGTHTPIVADDADYMVGAPRGIAAALVLAYGFGIVFAIRSAGLRGATGMLLAVAALALLAFPLPARSHPAALRFLTPLYLPVVAVILWMPAARLGPRRPWILAMLLAALHLGAGTRLLAAWRDADRRLPPFSLPDLEPVRDLLRAQGIDRAWGSYSTAWRLTFESGEQIVASQPWNERFLHHPLPYLDELRFATRAAWVLTPTVPTGLPAPAVFEGALGAAGGRWRRSPAGEAIVFHGFAPPFPARVEPWPGAGAAGDGDPRTASSHDGPGGVTLALPAPRVLDAVTLVAGVSGPRLLRSMDVEVSADGTTFEVVARRRRRGERDDLRWLNGQPQFVVGNDVVSIPLGGRTVRVLRVQPVASDEPWSLGEVLLHPAAPEGAVPWEDRLDPRLDWEGRREALLARPEPGNASWYGRLSIVLGR